MNYHIILQDKFFDSYIEDVYKLHQENNNVFWVRGNKDDCSLLKTERPVVYIGREKESIIDRLKTLNPGDKLFVSWYDLFIGDCILKSSISNRLYVYLMGGDFYDDPIVYHSYWLFDKYTKKIFDKLQLPQINLKRRPHNWGKTLNEYRCRRDYKRHIIDDYYKKLETIGRIDYLVTGAENYGEVDLIKKLYPSFRGKYVYGSFDQNFDLAKDVAPVGFFLGNRSLRILLGNSADPTNNHIDACIFLQKAITIDKKVICPLSYGSPAYSDFFQQWAQKHLQEQFSPITNYMGRKDYIDFLNKMDIVVMYHNRQQALGNIITSLVLGKPVFLKTINPVYAMLKNMGIPNLFDVSQIKDLNLLEVCRAAQNNRESCISIVHQYFSEQARLKDLSSLICNM